MNIAEHRESTPPGPEYLTVEEVASLCRTSPNTVRYWRHKNIGPPAFKVGRRVLYPRHEVEAWIESNRAGTEAEGA